MLRNTMVVFLVVLLAAPMFACSSKKADTEVADMGDVPVDTPVDPPTEDTRETPVDNESIDSEKMPVLEDVFFDYDKHALSMEAKRVLENNARQLKDASSTSITIEGHCDERGTNAYNLALGERRAKAAKNYLQSLGVSSSRIRVVSMGEEKPFDRGHNESAWSKNRRAHFVLN